MKLHRQIRLWEHHQDPYTVSLFLHLLCMANYLPNYKFRGKTQRVGELHTSYPLLAEETGIHINTVTDRLKKLQRSGEIRFKASNKGLDIYIVNYTKYQCAYSDSPTLDVAQNVAQDVACDVVQDVEQAPKNGEKVASTTCSPTLDVAHHVSNQINKENNIVSIKKEKNKKEKSGAESMAVAENATATKSTTELVTMFDQFRKAYKGTKRGLSIEMDNFKRKNENWREIIPLLMPALEREIAWREQMAAAGGFVPQWAYLQTWLNQRRWETEYESVQAAQPAAQPKGQPSTVTDTPPSDSEYGGSFGGL